MAEFRYRVSAEPPAATVWGVLTCQLGASRMMIRRLRLAEGISLNGVPVRTHQPVQVGDELRLVLPDRLAPGVEPEPVPLAIAYEDEDLIVLDKPPHMVVHPTHNCYHGTLANGLAYRFQERGEAPGIHPVHRLDRNTSGLVLFARHGFAHHVLAEQLEAFKLDRRYLGIARGLMFQDQGTIEEPIARRPGPGGFREVAAHGQSAATHYRVLARSQELDATLVELTLATGRTHQIRVHLAHLGHPLWGDALYGAPHPLAPRQALHAMTLAFRHPRSHELMTLSSPLPEDLQGFVAAIEAAP